MSAQFVFSTGRLCSHQTGEMYSPNKNVTMDQNTKNAILSMDKKGFVTFVNDRNNNMSDNMSNHIGEFYRGAKIFMTGGTGFVGKSVLEKLLRSCELLDTIYILMRPKRGLQVEQRLKELWKSPVFSKLKESNPDCFEKVKIIPGDVSMPNLGISDVDREKLIEQVNIVFHSAATVRFDEPLKVAVNLNTQGTLRMLDFCSEMKKLKVFLHVSTAYSNADKQEIEEIVYKPPFEPRSIIKCAESLPVELMDLLWTKMQGKHPNTYTLTKAMAEQLVQEYSEKLPIAIVRPSIVTASYKEPFPGWVENISGITGVMMEIGRGSLRTVVCNQNMKYDIIPVDFVANTIITAAWHTSVYRSNTMKIYNCTTGHLHNKTWGEYKDYVTKGALLYPSKYQYWYPNCTFRTNVLKNWFLSRLFHYIPAILFDVILRCSNKKAIMLRITKKFEVAAKNGSFFSTNEWIFKTATLSNLIDAVKFAEDGHNFSVDLSQGAGINWEEYVKVYMLGIRQYVLKDDISSLRMAKTKMNWFYWIHKGLQLVGLYFLFRIVFCKFV